MASTLENKEGKHKTFDEKKKNLLRGRAKVGDCFLA